MIWRINAHVFACAWCTLFMKYFKYINMYRNKVSQYIFDAS